MTTGIPEWTERAEKRGLDPLGMQTTSIALYQQLMPGIGNVTLRMRSTAHTLGWRSGTRAFNKRRNRAHDRTRCR